MKLEKSILAALSVLALASCSAKTDSYKPPANYIDPKTQETLDTLSSGGQPGVIKLNGVLVKADGHLDDRISMEQTLGSPSNKITIFDASKPKLNPEAKRKENYKPSQMGSYVNIGCDLTDDARIDGLKEVKNEKPKKEGEKMDTFGVAAAMADKVFICGDVEIAESISSINVNQIYLKDAHITKKAMVASITILADELNLEGENSISTFGDDWGVPSATAAPSIELTVYDQIIGEGKLSIKSSGGNVVEDKK